MLLKKQLQSQQNLNNAFLSLVTGGTQIIQSSLSISGGQMTLKNSVITDNANVSYLRIDPQGNQVIIYDGVSNQQLSVYSSSGSESTYITTINQSGNTSYGLIDITGASVDHLEINTNSWKPTYFGGTITTKLPTFTYPSGSTIPPVFKATGPNGDFRITVQDGNGRANLSWNTYFNGLYSESRYSTTGDAALRLNFDPTNGFQFFTASGGTSGNMITWTTGLINHINGNVGIGTTAPSKRLQVQMGTGPAIMVGGAGSGPRIQSYGLDADAQAWMGLGTDMAGGPYENSLYFPKGPTTNGRLTIGSYDGTTYSTKMTVLASGNVGIGTASPAYKLDVNGDIRSNGGWLRTINSTGWSNDSYGGGWYMTDGNWIRAYNSKGVLMEKNTAAINNLSYAQGNMQVMTNDGSSPIIGFHRSGYTAVGLYHGGFPDALKIRRSDGLFSNVAGLDPVVMTSMRLTLAQINDTTNLPSGIHTNNGDGLPDEFGGVFKTGWWHIYHSRHYDGNGFAAQIALPLNNQYESMYYRTSNGTSWNIWKSAGGGGVIKAVQRGTATMADNTGAINATITAVDLTKTFINFSSYNASSTSYNMIVGELTSTTNLSFTRPTSYVGVVTIKWEVIEYI